MFYKHHSSYMYNLWPRPTRDNLDCIHVHVCIIRILHECKRHSLASQGFAE